MKKLYIVISSWDKFDNHHKVNECVCSSLILAENKKVEIENKHREEIPFPFDWCTYQAFESLQCLGETTPENNAIFDEWYDVSCNQDSFIGCFIEEIDYYE